MNTRVVRSGVARFCRLGGEASGLAGHPKGPPIEPLCSLADGIFLLEVVGGSR